uniref:Myotubularin-related protein 10 n=1 Tax=Phallusia mammillata TaxID=59560 RepID=A0A6F9DMA8_9ASCI|nr:myotubularin-related protein 10 [Phallusia mammillata]
MADGSFKSYVDQAEVDYQRDKKLSLAYNKVFERPEDEIQSRLLPGELTIGHAKKVIKYRAHDPSKGTSGILICTNYRVSFITPEQPTFDLIEMHNKMLGEEDITLNNIDAIYVEYPNKRKKLLPKSKVKEGVLRLELHCKDFRVVAFNFKFTVKTEEIGVIQSILHHAYPTTVSLLFALDFNHRTNIDEICRVPLYRTYSAWDNLIRRFGLEEKWQVSAVNENFTVLDTMGAYFIVPAAFTGTQLMEAANQFTNGRLPVWCWTTPMGCHLIRSSEVRPEVDMVEWEKKFHNAIQNTDPKKRTFKIIEVSKSCPNCSQLQQSFIKLKSMCMPATEEDYWETDRHWFSSVHNSKWYHHVGTMLSVAVEATEWIVNKDHHVIVRENSGTEITPLLTSLIQILLDKNARTLLGFQSLIQREWVVGGHPFIDKLGHLVQPSKHGPNSVLNSESETALSVSPVFLLFLDCVYQLMRQYPCAFEMNPTFLTVLYDGTRNSAFDTFFFNNERQRIRTIKSSDPTRKADTLPIWAWPLQYDESEMRLFNNPLYKLQHLHISPKYFSELTSPNHAPRRNSSAHSLDVIDENSSDLSPTSGAAPSFPATSPSQHSLLEVPTADGSDEIDDKAQVYYNSKTGVMLIGTETPDNDKKKRKFSLRIKRPKGPSQSPAAGAVANDITESVSSSGFFHTRTLSTSKRPEILKETSERLRPNCGVANMKFWSSSHLRWITWSQSFGGGPAAQLERESMIFDEIYQLHSKLTKLDSMLDSSNINGTSFSSDDSGMYFCHTPSPTDSMPQNNYTVETPSLIPSYFPYSPVRGLGRKSLIGSPIANFLRGGSIFNFSKNSRSNKHHRSPSDLSITTPSGDENSTSNAAGGANSSASSNSLDAAPDENETHTSPVKGHHPKKAMMPPKERITYISSV